MIIGVDLGGMSAKAAVLSQNKLSGKVRVETSAVASFEETALDLVKLCMQSAEKAGVPFDEVKAIGIGSPGVIDSANGTVISWSNFGWKDVPLASLVSKYAGKPAFVLNDANAAALGEAKFGAGMKYRNSILITLGTGVGGGIILDGKLFEGYRSAGTEIGHMVIRQDGDLCTCGRKGCFERYASATALVKRTCKEMLVTRDSIMWKVGSTEGVDGRTAFDAARQGDKAALRVLSDYIAALGEGVANFVNIFRPEAIVIGGGISAEGEFLLAPLREYVLPRIYVSKEYAPLDIVAAALGNEAGLYGAAQYACDRLK